MKYLHVLKGMKTMPVPHLNETILNDESNTLEFSVLLAGQLHQNF